MKKHTECKPKMLKVREIQSVPTPDASERLSRVVDVLLRAAVRNATTSEETPNARKKEGFVGQIESLSNALTFTLIKPGTKLADVERSLDIILQDIALRRQQGQE